MNKTSKSTRNPFSFIGFQTYWRTYVLLLVPILLLPLPLVIGDDVSKCGYVLLLMAIYWVFELLPLAVTALLPVAMFPLMGIMSTKEITMFYMKDTCMLFLGGLIMAVAVEESGLHKRIALIALNTIGASDRLLLLGFMIPTAFCSMWISNTATTAMMIPIIEAVLSEIEHKNEDLNDNQSYGTFEGANKETSIAMGSATESNYKELSEGNEELGNIPEQVKRKVPSSRSKRAMLAMCVSMSANCGGTGTTIGTGPNLIMIELLLEAFPNCPLSFATWMEFALPQLVICLFIVWIWLQLYYLPLPWKKLDEKEKQKQEKENLQVKNVLKHHLDELGAASYEEKSVLMVFLMLVSLWFFRSPGFMTGWGDVLSDNYNEKDADKDITISDGTAAILITSILFVLPKKPLFVELFRRGRSSKTIESSPSILNWKLVEQKLPWGVILLFGGGFALAEGCSRSGLSDWIGSQLANMDISDTALLVVACVMASVLTQIASNAATANIITPILIVLSQKHCINPLYLVLAPTYACSFTFIFPVSTAPNAIAYEMAGISTLDMFKVGWLMNILTLGVTIGCTLSYGVPMFDLNNYPSWAAEENIDCMTDNLNRTISML